MEKYIEVFGITGDDRYDSFVPPSRAPEMRELLPRVQGAAWKGRLVLLQVDAGAGAALYGAADGRRIWLRPDTQERDYSRASDWSHPAGVRDEREEAKPEAVKVEPKAERTMTYTEALEAGYVPAGTALQRGYVSRLANPNEAEVRVAGGTRHGQLYVLLNNPQSNQYCIRQYLRKKRDGE